MGRCTNPTLPLARDPWIDPEFDIADAFVERAMGADVATVVIGGKIVVEDHQPRTIDVEGLYREVRAFCAKVPSSTSAMPTSAARIRDLLEIGRQKRPELYDLQADKPPVLVERGLRLEVPERLRYDGRVETALDKTVVRYAARALRDARVEAVAVCFLYSFLDHAHEAAARSSVGEQVKLRCDQDLPISYHLALACQNPLDFNCKLVGRERRQSRAPAHPLHNLWDLGQTQFVDNNSHGFSPVWEGDQFFARHQFRSELSGFRIWAMDRVLIWVVGERPSTTQ